LVFRNQIYWRVLHERFPNVYFEVARGSFQDNFEYCTKEGDFVERGTRPANDSHTKGTILKLSHAFSLLHNTLYEEQQHANITSNTFDFEKKYHLMSLLEDIHDELHHTSNECYICDFQFENNLSMSDDTQSETDN